MYLLAPSGFDNLIKTSQWFKNPICRRLHQEKGVDFGFELKGEPESIKSAPDLYWGYHLPGKFASEWYYHQEKRQELLSRISHIASLKPAYINLHGIHLWWQPPSSEHLHRYQNRSEPQEILKVLNSTIDLIRDLKRHFEIVTIENYPLYNLYQKDGRYVPETYLYTGAGRLDDLSYIKKKTGVEILLDIEHLILTLNFLNRQKNYQNVPREKIVNPTKEDREIRKIFGFYLPKGSYPYVDKETKISDIISKFAAKYYHLTGSTQDVISGKKDLTHGPIKIGDKIFRKNLRLVLAQKPETLLVETANSTDDPIFHHLRPNETELSFYNLCQILLEEL